NPPWLVAVPTADDRTLFVVEVSEVLMPADRGKERCVVLTVEALEERNAPILLLGANTTAPAAWFPSPGRVADPGEASPSPAIGFYPERHFRSALLRQDTVSRAPSAKQDRSGRPVFAVAPIDSASDFGRRLFQTWADWTSGFGEGLGESTADFTDSFSVFGPAVSGEQGPPESEPITGTSADAPLGAGGNVVPLNPSPQAAPSRIADMTAAK